MLGGVLGWFATTRLGLDFFTGLVLVAASMAAFGWLVDRLLIERVRGQGEEPGILLTIGPSILIVNLTLLVVGPAPMNVAGAIAAGPLFLGPVITTKRRRSEERRVGKEGVSTCRSRWATSHKK